ncbi:MAG TPA: CPBP family intramembrane glutamic endopeptidase [Gemmataceae bacterium]|nr:CPBP family intramembrane glutamic endopeptidase [Gemmataceae bacterium]
MTYLSAVRHPWPSAVLLIPLLGAYEIGVARLTGPNGESYRAGIDLWVRKWLAENGGYPPVVIPGVVLGLLLLWTAWRWKDRPENVFTAVSGVALEGVVFGLGLWALCMNAPALLDRAGQPTAAIGETDGRILTFLGVGLYEEVVFRLIGFALVARVIQVALIPALIARPVALVASAFAFALAHHFVQSDPFAPTVFFTRVMIGVYCGLLLWTRGLGVAVGAHVVYDIVVGLPRG